MGIKGLTTFLKQHSLLATYSNETGEVFGDLPIKTIVAGSTLAIDGLGLAFHIYRLAYFQHYESVVSSREIYRDDIHLITNLIPTMLNLSIIRKVAEEMMLNILLKHKVNVNMFLDGNKKPMKTQTKELRDDQHQIKESNLRMFFTKQILPSSFREKSSRSIKIPDTETFLNEFPIPILLFDQIFSFFQLLESQCTDGDFKSGASFTLTRCKAEADQSVAIASALDLSNQTYAVGLDSDYCLFGYPTNNDLWAQGNVQVQYLPLDTFIVNDYILQGYVITRQDIANEFDISEEIFLEASILVGNDYTDYFVSNKKLRKSVNFFRDICDDSERLRWPKMLSILSEMNSNFLIQSDNPDHQAAIEFSRDLFQMSDISHYLEGKNINHGRIDDKSSCLSHEDSLLFEQTLIENAENVSMRSLKAQILAPFQDIMYDDEDMLTLLDNIFDLMRTNQNPQNRLPPRLDWDDVQLSSLFQRSTSAALKGKSILGIKGDQDPSNIFHGPCFYRAMNDKRKRNAAELGRCLDAKSVKNRIESGTANKSSTRNALPIDAHKNIILQSISDNRVTIIQGETGCGKSSRVPVMLLEAPPPDPRLKEVRMFICQPRRLAVKSLAKRVRLTEPGLKDLIGLRMGHGVREYETKRTRAWFVTAGYLVRYLANNQKSFSNFTHLIIDEVHERSVDSDILCLLAKRLLEVNPTIRLVLMSATVSADMYQDYFNIPKSPIFVGARCFPIQEYFIEDIGDLLNFTSKERKKLHEISSKCMNTRCQTAPNAHYMSSLHHAAFQVALGVGREGSSVLIFVPGMADIVAITELFENMASLTKYNCIPIHSDIPFDDQLSIFDQSADGEIKIVIATNAAESSLTLPDVDHVICLGLCKAIAYNKKSHRQMLDMTWISKANATQRAGRTGRVRKGNVYRLYPRTAFLDFFCDFEIGEILRSPLDSVILNLRTIKQDEKITDLLTSCIEPPELNNIESSFASLYKKNFITEPSDEFDITALGDLAVSLGIDLSLGAMIGLGIQFGLLNETIELSAILSLPKSPWLLPNALLQEPEIYNEIMAKSLTSKAYFDEGVCSEPFSIINLLHQFDCCKRKNAFCKRYNLSFPRISILAATRDNLRQRVAQSLNIDVSTLRLNTPPQKMIKSKLTTLRIIQVWVFHDGIVRLPRQMKKNTEEAYSISFTGDEIRECHLNQVLDKENHAFTLKSENSVDYRGRFETVKINDDPQILGKLEFEQRLVSFSIEKEFDTIVNRIGNSLEVYISRSREKLAKPFLGDTFRLVQVLSCHRNINNHRGWKGRACGAWKSSCHDLNDIDCKTPEKSNVLFNKYVFDSSSTKIKGIKKAFNSLHHTFQRNDLENVSVFFLGTDSLKKSKIDIYSLCSAGSNLKDTDLFDLFATQQVTLKAFRDIKRQKIVFLEPNVDNNVASKSYLIDDMIPLGPRILYALSSGRRGNQSIRFLDSCQHKTHNLDDSKTYLEIRLKGSNTSKKWKWTETSGDSVLDPSCILASIKQHGNIDIYACGGNILELRGGSVRAEGLTVLPQDELFLKLAQRCIGEDSIAEKNNDRDTQGFFEKADNLRSFFRSTITDNDLKFSAEAVALLCNAFNTIDGIQMKPWTNKVHAPNKIFPTDECKNANEQNATRCKILGDDITPSSATVPFTGGDTRVFDPELMAIDWTAKTEELVERMILENIPPKEEKNCHRC